MSDFEKADQPNEVDELIRQLNAKAEGDLPPDDEAVARKIIERQLADITPEEGERIKQGMISKILRSLQEDELSDLADEILGEND